LSCFYNQNICFNNNFINLTYKVVFWLLVLYIPLAAQAQADKVVVRGIEISGNKRTKERTILRELDFSLGDSIDVADLMPRLEKNEQLLLNMGLFNLVKVNVGEWTPDSYEITVKIAVTESWYFYPIPIFELADRNFNVWWQEQGHSFERVNYGLRLYHINTTGRRDKSKLLVQLGYTQKYELKYELPFFNKKQTMGLGGRFLYSRSREVPYATENNKLLFYRGDADFPFSLLSVSLGTSYRPALRLRHSLSLGYTHYVLSDSVSRFNPHFFLGDKEQRSLSASYQFSYDNRGIAAYPVSGEYFSVLVEKKGLGVFNDVNLLTVMSLYARYFQLDAKSKWSIALEARAKMQLLRSKMPYFDNRNMGYGGDYVRGYELYVIDGSDFGLLKSSLHYELLNRHFNLGRMMPFKAFKVVPVKVYLGLNNDIGYANDPHYGQNNPLSNQFLWGGGVGLDLVVLENKVFRMEYTMNHLRESGLYLRFNVGL
jgi:outer membrane protein assembly factor BamA